MMEQGSSEAIGQRGNKETQYSIIPVLQYCIVSVIPVVVPSFQFYYPIGLTNLRFSLNPVQVL
jgi:hypothetical protein